MKQDKQDWLRGIAAAAPRFGRYQGIEAVQTGDEALAAARQFSAAWEKALSERRAHPARLAALRALLAQQGLDGFIVPHNDAYHNEYLPLHGQRLAWLTGFAGSAGLAVVLTDAAGVWSDGRYTLQLKAEVNGDCFDCLHISDEPATDWLRLRLKAGQRIGFDPWLHTPGDVARWRACVEGAGAALVAVARNPIDEAWDNQPPPPLAPLVPHDLKYAGETSASKRERIAAQLDEAGLDAALLTAPDSVAWLLNLRGADLAHTPIGLARAILHRDGHVELFVDGRKVNEALRAHLGNAVAIDEEENLVERLAALGAKGARVRMDEATATEALRAAFANAGGQAQMGADPCQLPKACKNAVELAGMRAAHVRDGVAVTRFLHWLSLHAPRSEVDELSATEALLRFRQETGCLIDLSFPPISGAGPNGAIVHYRASPETNRRLETGSLYLIDSGAQYLDGTTDITRTVAIGQPTDAMRLHFTAVLKGHIALGRAVFPVGTTGSQLDALARAPLWRLGLDYDHGTGHGVGSFLSVHEGPARISKIPNRVALMPGMILSNEPGYYKTGAYGIRIENLVAVESRVAPPGGERAMLGFETLTLAPLDRRLILVPELSAEERAWVNDYHARVLAELGPHLPDDTRAWLAEECAAL